MKLTLELNNQAKSPIRGSFLMPIIKGTIKKSGYEFLAKKDIALSAAIVSKKEIKKLNKIYRRCDQATDILSFAEYKNAEALKKEKAKELFLGELIICYDDIKEYAKKNKLDLKKETANVISHGVLHLLGFQHGTKMFNLQKRICPVVKLRLSPKDSRTKSPGNRK